MLLLLPIQIIFVTPHLYMIQSSHNETSELFSFFYEYRNKESSQTTLEAETDEARSKYLKMQVTENNEKSNTEKSSSRPTNKTKDEKHYNRWNEQGSNLRLDAAPIALPRQDQALNH